MSKLRMGDYTGALKGKVIDRVTWSNDATENFICLSIFLTDNQMVSFRFYLSLDEECELSDFKNGDLSNERLITPTPITRPKKERE